MRLEFQNFDQAQSLIWDYVDQLNRTHLFIHDPVIDQNVEEIGSQGGDIETVEDIMEFISQGYSLKGVSNITGMTFILSKVPDSNLFGYAESEWCDGPQRKGTYSPPLWAMEK